MQTTIDSLANANSKAQLARMLIEERAAHQQEHRELVSLQHNAQHAIDEQMRATAKCAMMENHVALLSRARDLLIRVVERMLDADDAKSAVIEGLRRDLEGMRR